MCCNILLLSKSHLKKQIKIKNKVKMSLPKIDSSLSYMPSPKNQNSYFLPKLSLPRGKAYERSDMVKKWKLDETNTQFK